MKTVLDLGQMLTAHARLSPQRIGARDLDRSMTFHQWNARACRLANALLGIGLSKGDRVAVLAYNAVEWVEIYAAAAKAGLVAAPLNFRLLAKEIRYIVDDAEAAAIIVQDQLVGALEEVGSELSVPPSRRIWFGAGRCPAGYVSYEKLMGDARDREPDVAPAPEDPWMLMYTSGTTGESKGRNTQSSRRRDIVSRHRDRTWPAPRGRRSARHADVPRQLALLLRRLRLLRRDHDSLQPQEL